MKPLPMLCEKEGCDKQATFDCERIPGTEPDDWQNEPTARCDEHAKGLIIKNPLTSAATTESAKEKP